MPDFFKEVDYDCAMEIEQLSRLTYELREHRRAVLAQYAAPDEATLLDMIASGALGEHPAYEHYLAARVLEQTREDARELLAARLQEANRT